MRHGYFMGYGYYGALILVIFLIIAVAILLVVILSSRKHINPYVHEPLEMLMERYARGEINAEEFREKKMVIAGEDQKHPDKAVSALMKKYVNGEITSKEYFKYKEMLHRTGFNKALDILNERYAKGEISEEEYNKIKKGIT